MSKAQATAGLYDDHDNYCDPREYAHFSLQAAVRGLLEMGFTQDAIETIALEAFTDYIAEQTRRQLSALRASVFGTEPPPF